MAGQPRDAHGLGGIELDAPSYTVRQKLFRNRYRVYDSDGTLVLRAKQKLFKMKEEFPFTDADGNTVFCVKAEGILDVAGDYAITDETTGEPIAILDKQWTMLKHVWKVRAPGDERLLATIESGSVFVELLRGVSTLFNLIPHTYTVDGADGQRLGEIQGKLSLQDTYEIRIDDPGDAPREALVAACIAIDALEGN